MPLERIRGAISRNDIDDLLATMPSVSAGELDMAIKECEKYYAHELAVARGVHDILAECRIRRTKNKIPAHGTYTYLLE